MHHRIHHHGFIYKSWGHILVTFGFILLPFIFLLFFSRVAHISAASLFGNIGISFTRLLVAYGIAVVLAWIFAVSFYKGRRADIALPIFDVLQSFPTFAALPLATYFWGSSNFTVIFFLVLTVIWPIFFSIISSLKLVKHDWEEAVKIYDIRGLHYVKDFLLPVTFPGLITGTIVGLGEGWEALIATEIIAGVPYGLGIFFDANSHNVTITTLGILGFLILIFSINKIIWLPLLEWGHRKVEE